MSESVEKILATQKADWIEFVTRYNKGGVNRWMPWERLQDIPAVAREMKKAAGGSHGS